MIEIQPSLLGRVMRQVSSEPQAFLICNKAAKQIAEMKLENFVWPISFKKGNLTLGVFDSFYIALFRAREIKFLEELNSQIMPSQINKIFYRFADKKENRF
jgi:hypothetical protein